MKTAMQKLLSEMSHPNWDRLSFDARYEIFDKLLDLEKEQIADAFRNGSTSSMLGGGHWTQYYNQTYNKEVL